mgnify:FL=1
MDAIKHGSRYHPYQNYRPASEILTKRQQNGFSVPFNNIQQTTEPNQPRTWNGRGNERGRDFVTMGSWGRTNKVSSCQGQMPEKGGLLSQSRPSLVTSPKVTFSTPVGGFSQPHHIVSPVKVSSDHKWGSCYMSTYVNKGGQTRPNGIVVNTPQQGMMRNPPRSAMHFSIPSKQTKPNSVVHGDSYRNLTQAALEPQPSCKLTTK